MPARVTPESPERCCPSNRLFLMVCALTGSISTLVYATCTIHPDENEAQVWALLNRHRTLRLVNQSQRWPDQVGGGFYCAVLRND